MSCQTEISSKEPVQENRITVHQFMDKPPRPGPGKVRDSFFCSFCGTELKKHLTAYNPFIMVCPKCKDVSEVVE